METLNDIGIVSAYSIWWNKIFSDFSTYVFVTLREVYTTGRLRDSSNSEGCRGIKKLKKKINKSCLWYRWIYW